MRSIYSVNIIIFLFNILLKISLAKESPIVEINNGKILGKFEDNYYSFKGIPYAKPPIDELRFEPPQKQMEWNGTFNAEKPASTCIRLELFSNIKYEFNLAGSEDCLYLNVYTPNIKPDSPLPVLLYIHQGGFMSGSGDDLLPTRLMGHQNIVLVTFNYRLGPLGFLSTDDDVISGNMGLKDQRMVIEWVNENINHFGGDPASVLLAGFSAGAASVEFHLLTEGIDKLIKSAWSISGSALNSWAIDLDPATEAFKLGALLNCSTLSSTDLKKCLKTLPADIVVSTVNKLFVFLNNPFKIFGPVIEKKSSTKPFITSHPKDLIIAEKCSKQIPWIASYTEEDAAILTAQFWDYKEDGKLFLEDLNENVYEYLPLILYYGKNMTINDSNCYTDSLLDRYGLKKGELNDNSFKNLSNLVTDIVMKNEIMESQKLHARYCGPTYGYVYDNPAPFNFVNILTKRTDIKLGAVHGDDIFLIFNFPPRDAYPLTEEDKKISENFLHMITNFASLGIPLFGDTELPKNDDSETGPFKSLRIKANETVVTEQTYIQEKVYDEVIHLLQCI